MHPSIILALSIFLLHSPTTNAASNQSIRTSILANKEVTIWKTVIYPDEKHILKMHRHDHNRVVVALTKGILKIRTNRGSTRYFKLEKEQAYYLPKDIPGELHTDENISGHPIKVLVMEFNQ